MGVIRCIAVGIALLVLVNGAPSEERPEAAAKVEPVESLITVEEEAKDATPGQRQKRWYNIYGFGSPVTNPYRNNEYDQEEPFLHIYKRLKDISALVRQQSTQQIPQPIPVYLPVIFIPTSCRCPTNNKTSQNGTDPDLESRFPEMEDPRQNWGFNSPETDDDGVIYNRPISLVPIPVSTSRPPPPVEHGSVQADANSTNQESQMPQGQGGVDQSNNDPGSVEPPSACDTALLNCCHRAQVTYNCFASQGCTDISQLAYNSKPCELSSIFRVITKYQKYYGQRTG